MNIKKIIVSIFLSIVCLMPVGVEAKEITVVNSNNKIVEKDSNIFVDSMLIADDTNRETKWDICKNPNSLKVFKFIGNLLKVAFIVVPILLIVLGSIDFMKAVVAGKEDDIKKAQSVFVKRIIAAVIVFLIPLIVNIIMGILPGADGSNCLTCVLNPSTC